MKRYRLEDLPALFERVQQPFHDGYYAMYSSVYDGIVTDPALMLVPIDDHVVHRGDGVFETFKCLNGNVYNMWAHLERLEQSADALHLDPGLTLEEIAGVIVQTVAAGQHADALIRVLVSRGPGSFGVNPYDCPSPRLYVTVYRLKPPFMDTHPQGARVMSSVIPVKRPFYAGVKNCNYLPNMLMKKEAVDAGVDFVVAFDEGGNLAEGPTENIGIVTGDGELLFPSLNGILRGTTMMRVHELAAASADRELVAAVGFSDISRQQVLQAREILVVGTTPDVTSVREFDGNLVKDGQLGPVYRELSRLLLDDIHHNPALQTTVPGV